MLTGSQIREARKLLRWSRVRLSRNALIPETLIEAIESFDGPAWLNVQQEGSIRRVCEEASVRFVIDGEGHPQAVMAGHAFGLALADNAILRC